MFLIIYNTISCLLTGDEIMKLYIKQKVFSWRSKFFIKDENGNDKYYAEGEIFSWGRKLHIYDMNNNEVAFIRQKLFTFLPKYYIEIGGFTFIIIKQFTWLRSKYRFEGLSWTMEGNITSHEYQLVDNNELIMNMSKHWFTWGDSYELDIINLRNELKCLCIALAIDCMNEGSGSSSSTSSTN